MQIHNMLESNGEGHGFKAGNIRLVKIKSDVVEVCKQNRQVITYRRVEGVQDNETNLDT